MSTMSRKGDTTHTVLVFPNGRNFRNQNRTNFTHYMNVYRNLCLMRWLRKIFKRRKHKKQKGHNQTNMPSISGDLMSEREKEDINRAIALSLVEEHKNGNNVDEDEQLVRAIKESLNMESPHRSENGKHRQAVQKGFAMGSRICGGCNTEIVYGRYLSCLNAFWHPECFRCRICNLSISDYEFSVSEGYPYHKACYKEKYHPKCDVCKHSIPTNPAGLIEYKMHPFWNQKFCPSHIDDGTPLCCSCERMEPRETGYVDLDDGRKLCLECFGSAIMDTNECQPLYIAVQKFYQGLDMKLDEQIPLLLVKRQGHNHASETRGICLLEKPLIRTMSKRPGFRTRNRRSDMRAQTHKPTKFLILYGLPRLLAGSILAHQMMHAWLRLQQGYETLNQEVEEGMCQVMAHMWLEAELRSASDSNFVSGSDKIPHFERRIGECFKHQIELDTCHVYGDGFRAGQNAVRKYGLHKTLHHIRRTGNFPS